MLMHTHVEKKLNEFIRVFLLECTPFFHSAAFTAEIDDQTERKFMAPV